MQKIELTSILMNQLFLVIGYFFFDWTMFELMFFCWVEPVVAFFLRGYLLAWLPMRLGLFRGKLWLVLEALWVLISSAAALWAIVALNSNTSFSLEWLVFLVLFALVLFMPIIMQMRHGIIPDAQTMPIQTQILIHPLQLFTTYGILAWALVGLYLHWPEVAVLGVLTLPKLGVELLIFNKLRRALPPASN